MLNADFGKGHHVDSYGFVHPPAPPYTHTLAFTRNTVSMLRGKIPNMPTAPQPTYPLTTFPTHPLQTLPTQLSQFT